MRTPTEFHGQNGYRLPFRPFVFFLFAALVGFSACQPGSNSVPSPGAGSGPTQSPFTAEGTVDGGGGNGIDGRAIELYHKRIDQLPEYRKYILPILRNMSKGKPDVFIAYLTWAVREKPWYFVPRELPLLPKERIQLAFQSDQLALHSEKEIFIYEPAYAAKSAKDKAYLLMHEMVMAARFLMKKSPIEQCETLSRVIQRSCQDPEYARMAQSYVPKDGSNPRILDGIDHESVRAMTVFLMEERQDLSARNVNRTRLRLQFHFPWDEMISHMSAIEVQDAIRRHVYSNERMSILDDDGRLYSGTCSLGDRLDFRSDMSFGKVLSLKARLPQDTEPSPSMHVHDDPHSAPFDLFFNMSYMVSDSNLMTKGVSDPFEPSRFVDLIEFLPYGYHYQNDGDEQYLFRLYISRDEIPRIIKFELAPVTILHKKTGRSSSPTQVELVRNRSENSYSCIPTRELEKAQSRAPAPLPEARPEARPEKLPEKMPEKPPEIPSVEPEKDANPQ